MFLPIRREKRLPRVLTSAPIVPSLTPVRGLNVRTHTELTRPDKRSPLDIEAHTFLLDRVDGACLDAIINYPVPEYYYEVRDQMGRGGNTMRQGSFLVGSAGILPPARRDCISRLADDRVRMENVSTAVIFAAVGDVLKVSVRSTSHAVDAAELAQSIFGKHPLAGGHTASAGATVPLGVFSLTSLDGDLKKEAWEVYSKVIMAKIMHICGDK